MQLALDHWALEKLMAFDAEAAELEDGGDAEPDADAEEDGVDTGVIFPRSAV